MENYTLGLYKQVKKGMYHEVKKAAEHNQQPISDM